MSGVQREFSEETSICSTAGCLKPTLRGKDLCDECDSYVGFSQRLKDFDTSVPEKEKDLTKIGNMSNTSDTPDIPDMVNHPPHYGKGGIECIDAIRSMLSEEEYKGFLKGTVIKYLWRCSHKGKEEEDVEKANWYLQRLREVMGSIESIT